MTTDLFVSKYTISGSTVSAAISPVTVEATPSLFAIDIIRSTNYIAVGYIKVGTTAHLVKYYNTSLTLQTSKTLNSTWSVATGMSFGFGLVESSTADTLYAVAGVSPTLTLGETFQLYGHYSSWEVPYASSVVTHLDSTNYHNFKMTTRPFIHDGIVYAACVDVAAYSYKSYALVQFINKTGPYTTTSQAERISAVGFWGANIAGDGGVMASGTFSTARDTWNNVAVVNNKFFIINSYITDLTSLYEYPGTSTDCNPILPQYSTAARLFLYDTTQTPAMAGYNTGTAQVVCSNTVLGIDGLGVAPGALWPNQYAMAKKTSSASGFTNGDVINYVLERVWQDNYGNTHNIESQTIQYEAATNYQHCTIYTYSSQYLYTKYGDVGYKCATNIYRTDPNGTIPYYLTTVYSTTTSYTDTNSAALDYSRALPSASGELSTKLAASPRASCMWKSRIAILPADNPRSIWYTAPIQDGVFPQFKDGLEITIPQALNELTAIASMDGTLYAFTEDQVFTIYGEPYGATGENGTLSLPEMRFNGVGCRDSRSLILTPKGLVFHSAKGFYLILRNQELVYIGDGPFSSRANTVIGAHVNEEFGEATFLFSESGVDPVTGDTLTTAWVYDYNQNEWFKRGFNLAANTAADLFESDGDLSIVASSKIYYETTTKETITAYESPWIRLGSLQGYQRLYNILLKTQLVTACNLTIDLYVDYVDTSVYTWNLDSTTYTLTQGTIKLSAPTQKCEAFKLRIYMESQSTGGNLNLQGITAEIGVKPTTYKQSTGTNNT
jgi:hypothetical protein